MTVTVTGLEKAQAAFEEILKSIDSPEAMRRLGGYIIRTIRNRTRGEGKGVGSPGGNRVKLKKVSSKYAKWRVKQDRHPEAATGTASNLTFKGTMLNSMIIKEATRTKLFIGFRSQKQADKAEGQEKQGRKFLFLGGKEIKDAAAWVKMNLKRL